MIDNVLLISIDDMNFWPLAGGHPQVIAPNIMQRLGGRACVFQNAMTPVPSCAASRTATLYGRSPASTGVYNNKANWTDAYPPDQRLSFVGRLHDGGMTTILAGKLTHSVVDNADWTLVKTDGNDRFPLVSQAAQLGLVGPTFDFGASPEGERLTDKENTQYIVERMASGDTGKVWALGLHRPHTPLVVPRRFLDLFPPAEEIALPPGMTAFNPNDDSGLALLPAEALNLINSNRKVAAAIYGTGEYKAWLRAHLAAIAYADDCVRRALNQLDACGLAERTLVVLWSDNGAQFGERQCARKFTLWDTSLRVPFMIAGPGIAARNVTAPVSLLDIYPTLASLLDITPPHPLDGDDLTPVLAGYANSIGVAVSYWLRKNDPGIAVSVRTESHRVTRYWAGGLELYDHAADPYELTNLVPPGQPIAPETQALIDDLLAYVPSALHDPVGSSENE